jgi:hypothetical protein
MAPPAMLRLLQVLAKLRLQRMRHPQQQQPQLEQQQLQRQQQAVLPAAAWNLCVQ